MKASDILSGIVFIGISVFVYLAPRMGWLPPGQVVDDRMIPIGLVVGIFFLVSGITSNSKPQPAPNYSPQPQSTSSVSSQQVKTLVICPRCHSRVPEESKFCLECGEPLTKERF